tara:strand:- start:320 stop:961 length:642 start_codon:yes stop_codon:yes gene_type:complete
MDNTKSKLKKLILATHNDGKIKEFENLLSNFEIGILNLSKLNIQSEPEENGNSFSENAQIKIDYYLSKVKKMKKFITRETYLLSEDSGIEIDFLNGEPGIRSARYGGDLNTEERNQLILDKLKGVEDKRNARYVSCIKLINIFDQSQYEFIGHFTGTISHEIYSGGGFGYDPIFIPLGYNETVSKLGDDVKNEISHRAIATKKMVKKLFSDER